MPRRRGRDPNLRRERARTSITNLSAIIEDDSIPRRIRDVAARDILRFSKKHGQRADSEITSQICRKCESLLIPSVNARVRIRANRKIVTCLRCDGRKVSILRGEYSE